MQDLEVPIHVAVQSPGTHIFVPPHTLHYGHSLGSSVSEALGVVTLQTAETFAREGEPPACPFEEEDEDDESAEPLLFHKLIEQKHLLQKPQRSHKRTVPHGPTDRRKAKHLRFKHVKSSYN